MEGHPCHKAPQTQFFLDHDDDKEWLQGWKPTDLWEIWKAGNLARASQNLLSLTVVWESSIAIHSTMSPKSEENNCKLVAKDLSLFEKYHAERNLTTRRNRGTSAHGPLCTMLWKFSHSAQPGVGNSFGLITAHNRCTVSEAVPMRIQIVQWLPCGPLRRPLRHQLTCVHGFSADSCRKPKHFAWW